MKTYEAPGWLLKQCIMTKVDENFQVSLLVITCQIIATNKYGRLHIISHIQVFDH